MISDKWKKGRQNLISHWSCRAKFLCLICYLSFTASDVVFCPRQRRKIPRPPMAGQGILLLAFCTRVPENRIIKECLEMFYRNTWHALDSQNDLPFLTCNLDDASCTSRTVFEDHSRSATALARGHARGIRLIVFTNSPQIQA